MLVMLHIDTSAQKASRLPARAGCAVLLHRATDALDRLVGIAVGRPRLGNGEACRGGGGHQSAETNNLDGSVYYIQLLCYQ